MTQRYDPAKLKDGWNTLPDGERFFYISNPALAPWDAKALAQAYRNKQVDADYIGDASIRGQAPS